MASRAAATSLNVAALLVAAGAGVRLGSNVPKAFHEIAGRTLLEHALARFIDHPLVRDVFVVVAADRVAQVQSMAGNSCVVTAGGVLRADSVRAGLERLGADIDAVLVHDVARPFVPAEVITRVVEALAAGADAVVPAVPVVDTIKAVRPDGVGEIVTSTLDREMLRAIQTPQGFRRAALVAAHREPREVTDDASLIEFAGGTVVVVAGADESFKITRPWDLRIAEALALAPAARPS
jgi:2-C-methyl-D-erythritol 4-phosphate cytidylyltransferase